VGLPASRPEDQKKVYRQTRVLFPLTDHVIRLHPEGKKTAGVYPLLADETCWFPAADLDETTWLTDHVIRLHPEGKKTAGVYPLLADETCWFPAADLDETTWKEDAPAFIAAGKATLVATTWGATNYSPVYGAVESGAARLMRMCTSLELMSVPLRPVSILG
jgi:hypothetical protein